MTVPGASLTQNELAGDARHSSGGRAEAQDSARDHCPRARSVGVGRAGGLLTTLHLEPTPARADITKRHTNYR